MRPTSLQFRSPKERTPDPYTPVVTCDGRKLDFNPTKGDPKKTTFSQAKRFSQYDSNAKQTGYMLGPGAYKADNLNIGRARITHAPLYAHNHAAKELTHNGYIMVGNHLVFDAHFMLPSQKKSVNDVDFRVDANTSLKSVHAEHFRSISSQGRYSPRVTNSNGFRPYSTNSKSKSTRPSSRVSGSPTKLNFSSLHASPYSRKKSSRGRGKTPRFTTVA